MGLPIRCLQRITTAFTLLVIPFLVGWAGGQGLPQSPYSAPSVVRRGLDRAPSDPLGMPTGAGVRGSDSLYLSNQMFQGLLGPIPNLQVGYLYRFGSSFTDQSRLTVDYLLPVTLGSGHSAVFGEAHGEFTNFWGSIKRVLQ